MRLRAATLDDLPLLRLWDEQPHVIAADPNDDWHWESELARQPAWREFLIAEHRGRPIGFAQIIDPQLEESHYWGAIGPNLRAIDIWIGELDNTGKGHGTTIMKMIIERCFSDPQVEAILVDPLAENTRAQAFYRRLGFRYIEHRQFGPDRCSVYRLNRTRNPRGPDKE